MAIRRALGASGGRLGWQLATEGALLAAAGGTLAVLVAPWGLRGLLALAPGRLSRLEDVTLDFTAVAGLISLAATVIFAFGPALQMRRAETFADLKHGGPGRSTAGRAGRARTSWLRPKSPWRRYCSSVRGSSSGPSSK